MTCLCLQAQPAVTGQLLYLLSFTHGLCGTARPPSPSHSPSHQTQPKPPTQAATDSLPARRLQHGAHPSLLAQHKELTPTSLKHGDQWTLSKQDLGRRREQDAQAVGVSCSTEGDPPASTFSLLSPGADPGQPIPLSAPVYILEGDRYAAHTRGKSTYLL